MTLKTVIRNFLLNFSNFLPFMDCVGQFYVNLTQAKVIIEEGDSIKKKPTEDWAVGKPAGRFPISECCGKTQLLVGGAHA